MHTKGYPQRRAQLRWKPNSFGKVFPAGRGLETCADTRPRKRWARSLRHGSGVRFLPCPRRRRVSCVKTQALRIGVRLSGIATMRTEDTWSIASATCGFGSEKAQGQCHRRRCALTSKASRSISVSQLRAAAKTNGRTPKSPVERCEGRKLVWCAQGRID